jgi:hypothetical protein
MLKYRPLKYRKRAAYARIVLVTLFLALACPNLLPAQTAAVGSLRGTLIDPSGGAVPNTTVQATSTTGQVYKATTSPTGAYQLNNLEVGSYTLEVAAAGFAPYKKENVAVVANRTEQVDITLTIEEQKEQVTVAGEALSVDTSPSNNASAVVLTGQQLDALPDDPDELQEDLEALAGPSTGPNGGQMYIDGFTAGQLPPKSSIREIRINQNPFSAEYDKVGYGRIEIFTKPGTNQWHGQSSLNTTESVLNARNPFITTSVPPYYSLEANENVGGPLGKNASLFFNADYRNIDDQSVLNIIDPPAGTPSTEANPRKRLNIGPRLDYQITKNNTFSIRYQYFWNSEMNDGVGGTSGALPSQGYNVSNQENTLQITDTQLIGAKVVNETRFQYLGQGNNQTPQSLLPAVIVLGNFINGGNSNGKVNDHQNHYEFQNYTSITHGNHFIKFGARLREVTDSNNATSGFNGTFTFANLTALANQTPSQFTITAGSPIASVGMFDAGPYFEDDWRLRPNITLSYGLRFETQSGIYDHADWAPRAGIAWGVGGGGKTAPKTVLRAGWGIFYDRFGSGSLLQAERENGITQQVFTVDNPSFYPNIPSISTLQAEQNSNAVPTIYRIAPNLHAPMLMQTAASVERQVTKKVNVSVSYLNSRGYNQLLTDNINSPFVLQNGVRVPTSVANGGSYPTGIPEALYQFQSTGIFRQNQLVVNTTIRAGAKVMLNGYYTLNFANSDASGVNSFPSNPYDQLADFGRATFDVRHRAFLGGTIALPWGLRASPFMIISSGTPYNVSLSQDLIGSTVLNQRPGLVSSATCATTQISGTNSNIYCTQFGTFNSQPTPGEPLVPINFLTGPGHFSLNLRLAKTFNFGGKSGEGTVGRQGGPPGGGGGGPRGGGGGGGRPPGGFGGPGGPGGGGPNANTGRYNFTISINARNMFNNVNVATPIGVLTSPRFGTSNALGGNGPGGGGPGGNAANRALYLQGVFAF